MDSCVQRAGQKLKKKEGDLVCASFLVQMRSSITLDDVRMRQAEEYLHLLAELVTYLLDRL